jgi:hypothetical protein
MARRASSAGSRCSSSSTLSSFSSLTGSFSVALSQLSINICLHAFCTISSLRVVGGEHTAHTAQAQVRTHTHTHTHTRQTKDPPIRETVLEQFDAIGDRESLHMDSLSEDVVRLSFCKRDKEIAVQEGRAQQ